MANGHKGTIYLRGKTWTIGFTVNGRRVREGVGPSKRMAEMVLAKRTTDAMQGLYFPQKRELGRIPFQEFAGRLLFAEICRSVNFGSASTKERIPMLLNNRTSREVPGLDIKGNPIDPVRYIELVVIPAMQYMDLSSTDHAQKQRELKLVATMFYRLKIFIERCLESGDRDQARRLYADAQRAILHVPDSRIRAMFCRRIKELGHQVVDPSKRIDGSVNS
jgi:hypothetical protein